MNFKEFLNEETYKEFFAKILKKYKVESPDELSDEQEKKFYAEVDAGWNSDSEAGKDGMNEKSYMGDDWDHLQAELVKAGAGYVDIYMIDSESVTLHNATLKDRKLRIALNAAYGKNYSTSSPDTETVLVTLTK
jgi:hypothetical protein